METLFIYLLKSSGLIGIFYLAYYFLLRKETFFDSNRWFLLAGFLTSVSLPLFFIKKIIFIERPKLRIEDLMALATPEKQINEANFSINWIEITALLYGGIALYLVTKIIVNAYSLYKLLQNQTFKKHEDFALVDIKEDVAPFSFFNFIVYNSSKYSDEELKSILLHEKVHSQERHSIDVLISKIFCIIFWFNPFVWLYKKAIIQNLEYIADSKAIQLIEDKKVYQKALLKVVSHQNCFPITNHFYQSLIKKRIVMLNKNQSNKRNSWKYAIIIPALVAFVFLFQIKIIAQEKEQITWSDKTSSENVILMNWNKNTKDEELKSDVEALKKQGVTLKYSKLKRNANGEITAIKIKFKDEKGNSGATELNSLNPIKPITFYKTDDAIGFGKPRMAFFKTNKNEKDGSEKHFEYSFKTTDSTSDETVDINSPNNADDKIHKKIIIKKSGDEKPLIIINGKKIEDDIAIDDLDIDGDFTGKIMFFNDDDFPKIFEKNGAIVLSTKKINDAMKAAKLELEKLGPDIEKNIRIEMEKVKPEIERALKELDATNPDFEKAKAEMKQAKEEMLKAKAEMEKAKAELEKAKLELKKNKN